jgi:transcriptional regulator with XRE-family HTH domain
MDYEVLASQLIRALRGRRSQTALSRRLGYRSNVVYTWESGGGFPTAARTFRLARRVGVEPADVVTRFYRQKPAWIASTDVASPEGVVAFLGGLRARQSIQTLAAATGRDRFRVSRWLKGASEPRLPDFLRLVQACSLRLLDLVAAFVDPTRLPEVADAWRMMESSRRAAGDAPWSHAVLRALELEQYRALAGHESGWIARRLGIDPAEEERCLELLSGAGQIRMNQGRWEPCQVLTVDTRRDPETTTKLAAWCARLGAERVASGSAGNFAFNVFAVSSQDLERLRGLQRDYFNQLRAVVAESAPVERVVVANMQLFALGEAG